MNRNSSLGPDGAVMNFAAEFHQGTADLERLNRSYIVMLPKHSAARSPGDYRPICLQNFSLKIVSKMLTTRLQQEIPKLIDVDQTCFIRGRSISENFIYAMELVQCCN